MVRSAQVFQELQHKGCQVPELLKPFHGPQERSPTAVCCWRISLDICWDLGVHLESHTVGVQDVSIVCQIDLVK